MLKESDVIIRPMIPEDIAAVMRIENSTNPTPWSEKIMHDCINVGFKCWSLLVNGELNPDAVWYYPEPTDAAAEIKGRLAFWKGVQVVE